MKRLILLSLFLILMGAQMFGKDLSLGAGLSVKNAYLYLILLVLAIEAAVNKYKGKSHETWNELGGIHLPFILLISYALFSCLFVSFIGAYPDYVISENLIALKSKLVDHYLFFIAFFYGVRSSKDALWVAKYIVWIIVLSNIVTLVDVYDIPDLGIIHQRADSRVSGPLGESNQYGAFMVLFLPIIAALIWRAVRLEHLVFIFGGIVSLALLILSASRGAFVGLTVGTLLGTLYVRHLLRFGQAVRIAGGGAALVVVVLIIISYQFSDLFSTRIERTTTGDISTISSGRSVLWGFALSAMIQKPITFIVGYGWNTFQPFTGHASHNTYLTYLFNLGAIGIVLYLTLIRQIIRATRKGIEASEAFEKPYLLGFLFGFLSILMAIFFVNLYKPWLFFWAYTGLMMRVVFETSAQSIRR